MKKLTKAEYELCDKIAVKALDMGFYHGDKLTAYMDITNAAKYFDMNLEDWLNADDMDFVHDITGIYDNIVRTTPIKFENCFVPRFARRGRV